MRHFLNKLKPRTTRYDFVSFDIETYGDTNEFYFVNVCHRFKNGFKHKKFYDKSEFRNYILTRKYRNKRVVAHNLGFDFNEIFFKSTDFNDFHRTIKGSRLIFAKHKPTNIKFYDTMNYFQGSLEKMGESIGLEKSSHPSFWIPTDDGYIVRKPNNLQEDYELTKYCERDCEVLIKFMEDLQSEVISSGGILKTTSSSTAFDIFQRKYLPTTLIKEQVVLNKDIKPLIFESYYGGRTEVFKKVEQDLFYYDINSLYPSVMLEEYPLPNSIRHVKKPSHENFDYFGVSTVDIECPNIDKPYLPVRTKENLIFPQGRFTRTYNHEDIKFALSLGYIVRDIKEQYIYTKGFFPFRDFILDHYKKRLYYKSIGSTKEFAVKIFMNSTYGKFGMKSVQESTITNTNFMSKEEYQEFLKTLNDGEYKEHNGIYTFQKTVPYDGKECYPIFASYTTSKARRKMYSYINHPEVVYTDTDSIVTTKEFPTSNLLGELKLEGEFKLGIFMKPKTYYLEGNKTDVKMKGIIRPKVSDFTKLLKGEKITKFKFASIKESISNNLEINEKIIVKKLLSLDDKKRVWVGNNSKPIIWEGERCMNIGSNELQENQELWKLLSSQSLEEEDREELLVGAQVLTSLSIGMKQ